MPIYQIILLALIQGLTEFLPISSSGHLGLFHCFTDQCSSWDQDNVAMDISVHVGTLIAVLIYFRRDVFKMFCGIKDVATGNVKSENPKLLLFVIIGSIPVILAGLALHVFEPDWLKTLYVIAWTTLLFGIVLWWVDVKYPVTRSLDNLTYKDAILIGLAQVLALVPGVSRSGITMTAARTLGFSRAESAHYSMLLAMVAITGAGTLIGLDLIKDGNTQLDQDALIGVVTSFFSSWIVLALMMKYLEKFSFMPFAVYRIILGGLLLVLLYTGVIA